MQVQIPQNQKFKKFHRSVCFNSGKLIRLQTTIKSNKPLNVMYLYGLVSLCASSLTFNHLKMVWQTAVKYTKFKRLFKKKKMISSKFYLTKRFHTETLLSKIYCLSNKICLNKFCHLKLVKRKNRRFKKKRVILCVFPRLPVTAKPLGIRMGKGKGVVDFWQVPIKVGQLLVKIRKDVHPEQSKLALLQIQKRIPFKTKIILLK